jgi:hypothetical protein
MTARTDPRGPHENTGKLLLVSEDNAPIPGPFIGRRPVEQAQVIRLELETDAGSLSGYLAEIRGTTQGRPVDVLME